MRYRHFLNTDRGWGWCSLTASKFLWRDRGFAGEDRGNFLDCLGQSKYPLLCFKYHTFLKPFHKSLISSVPPNVWCGDGSVWVASPPPFGDSDWVVLGCNFPRPPTPNSPKFLIRGQVLVIRDWTTILSSPLYLVHDSAKSRPHLRAPPQSHPLPSSSPDFLSSPLPRSLL